MKQEGECRAVSPDEVELGPCVTSDRNLTDSDGITKRNSMTQLKCLRVAGPQDIVSFSPFLHLAALLSSVMTSLMVGKLSSSSGNLLHYLLSNQQQ